MKTKNNCPHPQEDRRIVVTHIVLTCETTRVKCFKCGQFITPPKTDC